MGLELNPSTGPEVEARSVCITGLSAGPYDFSFWHFTSFWQGQELAWVVTFYSGACSGNPPSNTGPVTLNSVWEQKSAVLTAPPGTQSARVAFVLYCIEGCAPLIYDANVDDVVLAPQQATAVAVRSFAARRSGGGVTLNWRTSSEVETLGFNVYRHQDGKLTRLNRTLIPSVFGETASGQTYSWLDRGGSRVNGNLRYRLQAVNLDGTRSWVGATAVPR
jgi:hypothetical protein